MSSNRIGLNSETSYLVRSNVSTSRSAAASLRRDGIFLRRRGFMVGHLLLAHVGCSDHVLPIAHARVLGKRTCRDDRCGYLQREMELRRALTLRRSCPGIQYIFHGRLKVRRSPGHDGEVMDLCRCGRNECIHGAAARFPMGDHPSTSSAMAPSTPMILPSNLGARSLRSHSSSRRRRSPAGKRSMPWRISAKVTTLRNTSSSSTRASHSTTPALGRGLVHSETTFVSSKKLTGRTALPP